MAEGKAILQGSGLPLITADSLAEAAEKAVAARLKLAAQEGDMAILITEQTRVIVQGMSGRIGQFHAADMIKYGTNVVGGVTPGKGGKTLLGRRLFNTLRAAGEATGAEASLVFVPSPFAADAIMEAADAGIRTAVSVTDRIPSQDMMRLKRFLRRYPAARKMRLIGPNCAGVISPGKGFMRIMPPHIQMQGRVGIVGRSGTPGYEAASQLKALGIGVSTSVGIGGDPINRSSFRDIQALFQADPDTDAVMMIGEIGGPQQAEAAAWVAQNMTRPVVAHIAGLSAPKRRKMGHAGAIISAFGESAQEKVEILSAAGITVAPNPSAMGSTIAQVLAVRAAAWEPGARPEPDPSRRQFQGAGGGDSDTI